MSITLQRVENIVLVQKKDGVGGLVTVGVARRH